MVKNTLKFNLKTAVAVLVGTVPATAMGTNSMTCEALQGKQFGPHKGMRIESAVWNDAGTTVTMPFPPIPVALPAHCEIKGIQEKRKGVDGQEYAIRFLLRLPAEWNKRFFFEAGGGTNGNLGLAAGVIPGAPSALDQGYAVVSQDSGHSNELNNIPEKGGVTSFGFDPQARANYGGASIEGVTESARAIIEAFYGKGEEQSYFFGCSKGGQEGMYVAQNHPELFDGIVASAPGFSLPRAAVAEAWDTQVLATAAGMTPANGHFSQFAASYSEAELELIDSVVIRACDADDGLEDGIVGAFDACTTERILPELNKHLCTGDGADTCLTKEKIKGMVKSHNGPHNSKSEALYTSFPWNPGMSDDGWRAWKLGLPGRTPAINILMGAPSLAAIFSTPPKALSSDPQESFLYHLNYDFDVDAQKIYATDETFTRSAWEDIGARSPDIQAFAQSGGKMIVPHGVNDPVFSFTDTANWWKEVNEKLNHKAGEAVRVFAVPGMAHCAGGPATDTFNALEAIVAWVENDIAPERIVAKAGDNSPWPGRERPLCPYPKVATYAGEGNIEAAASFVCK